MCGRLLRFHKAQHPRKGLFTWVADRVYSALRKGLNYAVILVVRPIEDILTRVEMALKLLPAEMAEEAR